MVKNTGGRKRGSRNRGYFYRAGRDWYFTEEKLMVPLRHADGAHIKNRKAPDRVLKDAFARHLLHRQQQPQDPGRDATVTVLEVCQAYLANAKATGAAKTHHDRADTLFDFCFGIPPGFRNKNGTAQTKLSAARKKEIESKRIHPGYGRKSVAELLPLDVDQWLNSHPTWKGGRRSRIQALKRALNYGVESGLIERNPIRGYRTPRAVARITYITPEQEAAAYQHANPAFATALRVCIRTGARFGSEFAVITADHVTDLGERMEWKLDASEVKTRRMRVIRITDPEIIKLVREQMKKRRRGTPLFRNTKGQPWTRQNLSLAFRNLKKRLQRNGIRLDDDACMYSCRHTYAMRILQGHWSGKPTNIETLARLMGNAPQVCREHYLQWSEIDNDPLWDAA